MGRFEVILKSKTSFNTTENDCLNAGRGFEMSLSDTSMQYMEDPQFVIKGSSIDYMYIINEETFPNGAKIVTEGSYGNWIWVLLEGMVEVTKTTPSGPVVIARLGQGSFIGTLISLFYGSLKRSATVTAIGKVHLGVLDHERLHSDFSCCSWNFRNMLASYTNRLYKITNNVVKPPQEKLSLRRLIKEKKPFTRERHVINEVFHIIEGEACVVKKGIKGPFPVLELSKNDFFGPVPFMDIQQEFRSAQIFSSNDLRIEKIDIGMLNEEYNEMPVTLKNLIYHAGSCIYKTTNMLSCVR